MMTDSRFIHYTLGHFRLDKEHREMFSMMDEIIEVLRKELFELGDKLVDELQKFHNLHNEYEHGLMKLYDYPYLDNHLSVTETQTIAALIKLKAHVGRNLSHHEIITFEQVFLNHIDHYDRQFVDYLKIKELDIWKK